MKKIVLFKKEIKPLEIADWSKAELRRKFWAQFRSEAFIHVRLVFVVLFFATAFIFVTDNELEIEMASSAELHQALKHYVLMGKLRQRVLNHEKEVNAINEPQKP
jgi:hypothetical protein